MRVVALDGVRWDRVPAPLGPDRAVEMLEQGSVVHLPGLAFDIRPEERVVFAPAVASAKNVSFDPAAGRVGGAAAHQDVLRRMLERYSASAASLVEALCPRYRSHLERARASFRPVEIAGRVTSWRQDDTRLHIDAFPSSPVQGRRILRVFTNVNPEGRPRVWRVGEPFSDVVRRLGPKVKKPLPGSAALLQFLRLTKSRRSTYDALMLQLHDLMKADAAYQKESPQETVEFPAGSTWVAFTDQVSHAAMAGQYQLEQTFLLPVASMKAPDLAPLTLIEGMNESLRSAD